MSKKLLPILALICFSQMVFAQDIPVLPLPVHVEEGRQAVSYKATSLSFEGIDSAGAARLNWHWDRFEKERVQRDAKKIRFVLLAVGTATELPPFAEAWKDKIGNEGYILVFDAKQKIVVANTETGLFYALQTIRQLSRANYGRELKIADWPSFAHRAIYDDISRGPISTMDYLKKQVERLAELKINYLSFYIEHVVQPLSHPDFAPVDGKLTIPQIKELCAYAAKFHMQVIGSFQSFGHFEKILSLPQYSSMGETANMISPLDPKAKQFLADVIGELCDAFSAPFFNVNCDETFDLGKGKSKAYTDSVGVTKYYADHIKFLYDVVKRHNRQLMMWGDIALEHEEMLDMLPRDIIYLTWEYGSQSSFAKWIDPFQKRGLHYMVCPGILNSNRMFPDMVMASANIDGFLEEGKEKNAMGVITTIWDEGSAFLFSGDWYGVYKAADKSWNVHVTGKPSFDRRFTVTAYGDAGGSYVRALDSLMELRKPSLTFNLNENIWRQKILPDSGRRLIINNSEVGAVLRTLQHARSAIGAARPVRNMADIRTLTFAIDQYILMMDTRLQLPQAMRDYEQALVYAESAPAKTLGLLKKTATSIAVLKERYVALKKRFREDWLRENQPYSLGIAAAPFEEKSKSLAGLEKEIRSQAGTLAQAGKMPSAASLRLSVIESDNYYFQNWLLSGPYPLENGQPPAFLYFGNSLADKTPKPGDLFTYNNKSYRWSKYASPNGGITEIDDFYREKKTGVAYAFCTITTDKAVQAPAFVMTTSGVEVFSNGIKIFSNGKTTDQPATKEERMLLPLKAGVNNVLFKIPASGHNWSFSFRLDKNYTVTNQKHKYFLNTEKGNHEAE